MMEISEEVVPYMEEVHPSLCPAASVFAAIQNACEPGTMSETSLLRADVRWRAGILTQQVTRAAIQAAVGHY